MIEIDPGPAIYLRGGGGKKYLLVIIVIDQTMVLLFFPNKHPGIFFKKELYLHFVFVWRRIIR